MEFLGMVSVFLTGIFLICCSIGIVYFFFPYKGLVMRIKSQGCYNCKWENDGDRYEIFPKCNCPVKANRDSVTGKYESLCIYTVGTGACKWGER